jgi:hypothetical protein
MQQPGKEIAKFYPTKWMKVIRIGTLLVLFAWIFLFCFVTFTKLYSIGFLPKMLYFIIIIGGVIIFLLLINSAYISPIILYQNGIQPMGTKLNYWFFNLKNEIIYFHDIKDITFLRTDSLTGEVFQVKLNNDKSLYQRVDGKNQLNVILKTFKKFK